MAEISEQVAGPDLRLVSLAVRPIGLPRFNIGGHFRECGLSLVLGHSGPSSIVRQFALFTDASPLVTHEVFSAAHALSVIVAVLVCEVFRPVILIVARPPRRTNKSVESNGRGVLCRSFHGD